MKKNHSISSFKPIFLIVIAMFISATMMAQTDVQADSTRQETPEKEKKEKKKRDSFKVFGGANFNMLNISSEVYESSMNVGFQLGASYKRGRFFYWEIGARYNHYNYSLKDMVASIDSSNTYNTFSVPTIDIPITGGINVLYFMDRVVGLRLFLSVVPSIGLSVGDNDLGITKDDVNSFNLLGQAGVGIDIAFIFIEAGFNYGFTDLFKNYSPSNPFQGYAGIGFRF